MTSKSFFFTLILISVFISNAQARKIKRSILDKLSDYEICSLKRCGRVKPKGSMCEVVVGKDGFREASCFCPKSCPKMNSPVCSIYGKQYNNECLLHMEACRKKRYIRIANQGACIASQERCAADELKQFPFRLLAWFVHLKQNDEFGMIDPTQTIQKMDDLELENISNWKFEKLDKNKNAELSPRELKSFRYALMPLEHCSKDFFRKCDGNFDGKLQKVEWDNCFVVRAIQWYDNKYQSPLNGYEDLH